MNNAVAETGQITDPDDRLSAILQGLLLVLDKKVCRTKLITLIYLMDETNYRFRGKTMTGLAYRRISCAPNAQDDKISALLDEMAEDGLICIDGARSHRSRGYRASDDLDVSDLPLSGDDWIEIYTVVQKYGEMSGARIAQESRATEPMKDARENEPLRFRRDPSLTLTDQDIAADPFLEVADAIRDDLKIGDTLQRR